MQILLRKFGLYLLMENGSRLYLPKGLIENLLETKMIKKYTSRYV